MKTSSRETGRVSGSTDRQGVPADLVTAVAQAYGLKPPLPARRLTGGYANDVFLLEGERSVVLHIKHPPLDIDSLTWEHHLLELLSDRLSAVPVPICCTTTSRCG